MTGYGIPANASVLNTTVLSNFAYIDRSWVITGLSGICTAPVVREELEDGVDDHPYPQLALGTLDDEVPVATISDTVANREAVVSDHLDPDEAQAFALADAKDGRPLTDDGDARSSAKDQTLFGDKLFDGTGFFRAERNTCALGVDRGELRLFDTRLEPYTRLYGRRLEMRSIDEL